MREVLTSLHGAHVLTVGEADEFCRDGGIINWIIDQNRVRFDVNIDAAQSAELRVSSQLLDLARKVIGKPHKEGK